MKKTALFLTLGLCAGLASAQDLTSKKGEPILPEAGDWAIGFDASSFFNYAGNMFSGATTSNVAPTANWVNPGYMTITGKYFKDEKTALRASVRLGFASNKRVGMIGDATATAATYPNVPAMKEDDIKARYHNVGIGLGIEKRKGKTRLQGYYGAEAWLWNSGQSNHYDYGNNLAASGPTPVGVNAGTTTNFGTNAVTNGINAAWTGNIVTDTYGNTARLKDASLGWTWGIGVRAFIGAEYFIFPKISIGAEYGYGFGFSYTSNANYTTESVGGAPTAVVGTQTITVRHSHNIALDTDINGGGSNTGSGSLKLTLHF
ncbi:MAG: hypothetical protein ACHQRM_10945 [Bacteroidia bacterium]